MIWKAFLTGSRAYGTPRPDSDVDIVLRLPQDAVEILKSAVPKEKMREYPDNDSVSIWFDNLNLICVTSDKYFQVWAEGTAALMTKAPVTREVAIEELNSRGVTKALASQKPTNDSPLVKEATPDRTALSSDIPF